MSKKYYAPFPWKVDRDAKAYTPWTDSCSIVDAEGGTVCYLTRGYQPEAGDPDFVGGPSWDNAEFIVAAVNAYAGANS